jgi:Predicted membrane protein
LEVGTPVAFSPRVLGVFVYIKITSFFEMALIKDGNSAASVSLSGAIVRACYSISFLYGKQRKYL